MVAPIRTEGPPEGWPPRKAVLPLEEGDVTVTYPGTLSERSSTLLTKYLNLLFGMEREVG